MNKDDKFSEYLSGCSPDKIKEIRDYTITRYTDFGCKDSLGEKQEMVLLRMLSVYPDRDAMENATMLGEKRYTRQEVIDFHEDMYKIKDGCYSSYIPTMTAMQRQWGSLWLYLEQKRLKEKLDAKFPDAKTIIEENGLKCHVEPERPWARNTREQQLLKDSMNKQNKFSLNTFLCGVCCGIVPLLLMYFIFN